MKDLQKNQKNLRKTFDKVDDERINSILSNFETTNTSENSDAWNLVKELSGKKSKLPIFIEADDRLDAWKSHFQNLLNAESSNTDNPDSIEKLFDVFPEIKCGDFSQNEVDIALKDMFVENLLFTNITESVKKTSTFHN